jgi:hypothetical protein
MSLATPSCVQKLQAASHGPACVFSDSRMREICLSGSMGGNRNQNQVKPDCGDEAKANSIIHRETTVTAPVLDSTRDFTNGAPGQGSIHHYLLAPAATRLPDSRSAGSPAILQANIRKDGAVRSIAGSTVE